VLDFVCDGIFLCLRVLLLMRSSVCEIVVMLGIFVSKTVISNGNFVFESMVNDVNFVCLRVWILMGNLCV
jgi:hypothetical protein